MPSKRPLDRHGKPVGFGRDVAGLDTTELPKLEPSTFGQSNDERGRPKQSVSRPSNRPGGGPSDEARGR